MATATAQQLQLEALASALGARDTVDLPSGVGELSGRELAFVRHLVDGKNLTDAAEAAGWEAQDRLALGKAAHKAFEKPSVRRFYARCISRVAANADGVAARLTERSLALHDIAEEQRDAFHTAALRVTERELEAYALHQKGLSLGPNFQAILSVERHARDRAWSQFLAAAKEARDHNNVLGQMLGRIRITTGEESQTVLLTDAALRHLGQWRQEAIRDGQIRLGQTPTN